MKTVLLPTAPHDLMQPTLETALLFARRFEAYIEGFALRPPLAEIVSVDYGDGAHLGPRMNAATRKARRRRARSSRNSWRAPGIRARCGFAGEAVLALERGCSPPVMISWEAMPGSSDLTVLGKPAQRAAGPAHDDARSGAFRGRERPVLIAPPEAPRSIGETIPDRLERLHRDSTCCGHGHAAPASGPSVSSCSPQKARWSPPDRRATRQGPAPARARGGNRWRSPGGKGQSRAGDPRSRRIDRLRSPDQGRLYPEPDPPDDLRRGDEPYPRPCPDPGLHGPLRAGNRCADARIGCPGALIRVPCITWQARMRENALRCIQS